MGDILLNQIAYQKALPPPEVKDVSAFLTWINKPLGSYRVFAKTNSYLVIRGPAGRMFASGTSAYTFDRQGCFIGWTPDMGDIKRPLVVFSDGAKWEKTDLDTAQSEFSKDRR